MNKSVCIPIPTVWLMLVTAARGAPPAEGSTPAPSPPADPTAAGPGEPAAAPTGSPAAPAEAPSAAQPSAPPPPGAVDREEPPARVPFAGPVTPPITAAPAAEPPVPRRDLRLLVRIGVDIGGDDVSQPLTRGAGIGLPSGTGLAVSSGLIYAPSAPWALEVTLGYKFWALSEQSSGYVFDRFPLDAIVSVAGNSQRLGVGGTVHINPTLHCPNDGDCGRNRDVSFDVALGLIAQYVIEPNDALELGLRYTYINYSAMGASVAGSTIGVMVGVQL